MKRSEAREKVFKIIFQIDFHEDFADCYEKFMEEEGLKGAQGVYARYTIEQILDKQEQIDAAIVRCLKGWQFDRIPNTAKALLRLGVFEVLYNDDIPPVTAIDEAIKLANVYCEEKDVSFINGILHHLYQENENNG